MSFRVFSIVCALVWIAPALVAETAAPAAFTFLQQQEVEYIAIDEVGNVPKEIVLATVVNNGDFSLLSSMNFAVWTDYQAADPETEVPKAYKSVVKPAL